MFCSAALLLALCICRTGFCHVAPHDPENQEHEKFERDILLGEEEVDGFPRLSAEEKARRMR